MSKQTKAGDPCPYCERPLTSAFIAERSKRRGEAVRKALLASDKPIGRPLSFDPEEVLRLFRSGLSRRAIGRKLGVSYVAIARYVKERT